VPRAPDERIEKAKALYLQGAKLIDIASQLNVPEGTVRRWKCTHKWDSERSDKKANVRKNKGGQINNKNTVGHSPSVPLENKNAKKHGLFEKYLPKETLDIVNNMSLDPLDILWDNIQIAYAAIVRAQRIAYVRDQQDTTKEISKISNGKTSKTMEWNVEQAWDKQANFMKAQARAQSELRSLIKQYDIMLHNNWELASEEQKLRITKLKTDIAKTNGSDNSEELAKLDSVLKEIKGVI